MGLAAAAIAKEKGAFVAATTRNPARRDLVKASGADQVRWLLARLPALSCTMPLMHLHPSYVYLVCSLVRSTGSLVRFRRASDL